jgi:anti-anti-sigma factor
LCPRCLARQRKAVQLIVFSEETSPRGEPSRLQIGTLVEGRRHTISLCGELEIASAELLDRALADACSRGAEEIVLDMGGIEFMDSMGLNAIIRGRERCERHHCLLTLTPAQRPVHRVLVATNLDKRLEAAAPAPQRLNIRQERAEDRYRLILSGELDRGTADQLEATLGRLCEAGALEIEMDLRGLTLVNSSGLRAISRAKKLCADHHATFFVVPREDQIPLLEHGGLLSAVGTRREGDSPVA